jgi:crotonobetainyl-CoA:carnitine CoA-transferase CaiB-like acyl-CoA transferase
MTEHVIVDKVARAPIEAKCTQSSGALAGLKVVDLTRVLGGPYCTMILADHGADVIKVEPPQGDETREWGPPFRHHDAGRDSSYFAGVNRNKRSLALDLSLPEGREILLHLLENADVLVENFKTGTMERWNLGYENFLSARFPRLIHCRISGFGADGPLGGLVGYDAALQAMTGLMSVNGNRETGPLRLGTPVTDLSTGLYSAIGILMALYERTISGQGQFVDMTLYDCSLAMLHPQGANFLMSGRRPVALGNPHPNLAPCDKLTTRTGEIFIAVGNDNQFRKLTRIIGRPELADDPRFLTNSDRVTNRSRLSQELQVAMRDHDGTLLAQEFLKNGVPAGAVLFVDEALYAEHTKHRDMLVESETYSGIATPIKFSRSKHNALQPPPRYGQHNSEVLSEHKISQAKREDLIARAVVLKEKVRAK